ncbi:MAG: 2-phosphosulfolactate phosphatase [Bacteroidetes bacterium]|nr:2-phosphosulfolactate phosphatase [Bacteroidota bacterium]MCH8524889.1 2-phosphosulfolactate phosphatase [Balneolales bacterium]
MNPNIDVYTTTLSLNEDEVRGKTVVVIDVLRATSTIITAMHNNAKSLIATEDMGEASKIAQNLDPSRCLLCGERDGRQIEGFDLGNSPLEYTEEVVKDKTLILTTTNGTKAISRSSYANRVLIASFLNAKAVSEEIKSSGDEVILVCAGWKGRLSLEDVLCAGYIINLVYGGSLPEDAKDGAQVAAALYNRFADNILEVVSSSNHAKRLLGMGYSDDIGYCCSLDIVNIVPEVVEGVIRI